MNSLHSFYHQISCSLSLAGKNLKARKTYLVISMLFTLFFVAFYYLTHAILLKTYRHQAAMGPPIYKNLNYNLWAMQQWEKRSFGLRHSAMKDFDSMQYVCSKAWLKRKVVFDPAITSFEILAKHFFEIHNPALIKKESDKRSQYRSSVFYRNDE